MKDYSHHVHSKVQCRYCQDKVCPNDLYAHNTAKHWKSYHRCCYGRWYCSEGDHARLSRHCEFCGELTCNIGIHYRRFHWRSDYSCCYDRWYRSERDHSCVECKGCELTFSTNNDFERHRCPSLTPSAAAAAAGIPAAVSTASRTAALKEPLSEPTMKLVRNSPPRAPSYSPIPSPWDKKRQTFELKKIVREVMGDDDDDNYSSNDDSDQGPRFSLDTSMSPLLLEADKMDCN